MTITIAIMLYVIPYFLLPPLMHWSMDRYDPDKFGDNVERYIKMVSRVPVINALIFALAVVLLSIRAVIDLAIALLDKKDEA